MKVFGIAGTRYSGSTLLSMCLGAADGAFASGEIEEIGVTGVQVGCQIHAGACEFWTQEFLQLCRSDADHVYDRVRDRAADLYGARVIINSDKAPQRFVRHAAHSQVDGLIVLFKRPEAFANSAVVHDKMSFRAALDHYADVYEAILDCGVSVAAVVPYEAFASETASTLATLCSRLALTFEPAMEQFWVQSESFHVLAGNHGALAHLSSLDEFEATSDSAYWQETYGSSKVDWIQRNHKTITLDEVWKGEMTPRRRMTALGHRRSREMHRKLVRLWAIQ